MSLTVGETHRGLSVNGDRLADRLEELAQIGGLTGTNGCCRLALTDADRAGRDLVVDWMRDLGLEVTIDGIGNVIGAMSASSAAPVMTGSHIDTVGTGGRYDGSLGVLAGLEVIETVLAEGLNLERPLAVGFFTDEEGSRFPPDMLGSLVYAGGLGLEEALQIEGIDGSIVGDELDRIGYRGAGPCPGPVPHAFVELHIEQGPVLEAAGRRIGAVTGVQGISWTEVTITGQSNHAGTTPMSMRRDPAVAASAVALFVHELAHILGPPQVGTVGKVDLHPNLVNVVPATATLTVDLRNTDESVLADAEARLAAQLIELAAAHDVEITTRTLARFEPVEFDATVVDLIADVADEQGHEPLRMPSGAGHDAQMLARVCPAGMVFVPSQGGVSHNPAEHTDAADLEAGANVLLHTMIRFGDLRMSRKIQVGAAQLGPISADETRKEVVERLIHLLQRGADTRCDLVVFPELTLTTFFPRWYTDDPHGHDDYYETQMPGPETQPLFDEARRLGVGFCLGYAELTPDGHRFNTYVLVDKAGRQVGKYRKVHIPGHDDDQAWRSFQHLERRYFEESPDGFPVFRAFGGVVGMALCNDRRWPETYRVLGLQGVELILIGYNTPLHYAPDPEQNALQGFHNHLVMQAGAYQNGTWIVGVAKGGVEEGVESLSQTAIIAPSGQIVAQTITSGDVLVTARCDLDLCAPYKDTLFDFERYRRPEVYGLITERRGAVAPPEEQGAVAPPEEQGAVAPPPGEEDDV